MNQVEMKTSSGFTMTSSEVLADSREHDFDDEEIVMQMCTNKTKFLEFEGQTVHFDYKARSPKWVCRLK